MTGTAGAAHLGDYRTAAEPSSAGRRGPTKAWNSARSSDDLAASTPSILQPTGELGGARGADHRPSTSGDQATPHDQRHSGRALAPLGRRRRALTEAGRPAMMRVHGPISPRGIQIAIVDAMPSGQVPRGGSRSFRRDERGRKLAKRRLRPRSIHRAVGPILLVVALWDWLGEGADRRAGHHGPRPTERIARPAGAQTVPSTAVPHRRCRSSGGSPILIRLIVPPRSTARPTRDDLGAPSAKAPTPATPGPRSPTSVELGRASSCA